MFANIARNGHLFIYTGGSDHPRLTRDQNEKYRAVHDYFGHYLGRHSFGPVGEFNAWRAHCRQFSDTAIPSLTVETLGQNCWVNYGPYSQLIPLSGKP